MLMNFWDINDHIVNRLRMVRRAKGFTQNQVAEHLKIHRCQYSELELKRGCVTFSMLYCLCLLYNVSADYLLGLPKGLPFPDHEDIDALKETEDKSWKQIARNLKKVRTLKGVTQSQVADFLGVHRVFYDEYERGYSTPSANLLYQLCLYYNMSADYLLGLPKGMPYPDGVE